MKAITCNLKQHEKHAIMESCNAILRKNLLCQTNHIFSLQHRNVTTVKLIPEGRKNQAHFGVDGKAVLCVGFLPSTAVSISGLQSQSNTIKANSVRFLPQGSQQAPCLGVHNLTHRSYIHSMFTHADSLRAIEKLANCQ